MAKPIYVVVTPFFPSPESWRGAYCYDFVRALMAEGTYDVRVFVPGCDSDYQYGGVPVGRFRARALPFGALPWLWARWNARRFLDKLSERGIAFSDIAVCHGHTQEYAIYPLAVKRRNPSCLALLHHHNCPPVRLVLGRFGIVRGYSDIFYHWLRTLFARIDCHVCCSEQVREHLNDAFEDGGSGHIAYRDIRTGTLLGRLHRPFVCKRTLVLYNGYDDAQFKPVRRPHEGFVIGCIGNFHALKRQAVLVRAFALLRREHPQDTADWRLRFVGSGADLMAVRTLVGTEGLSAQVTFETEVDHSRLPAFYQAIDLFVLPTVFEGFCCVFMESAACGTPFVTTDIVSAREVLPQEDWPNWLCRPDDPSDLAAKIWDRFQHPKNQRLSRDMTYRSLVANFLNQLKKHSETKYME